MFLKHPEHGCLAAWAEPVEAMETKQAMLMREAARLMDQATPEVAGRTVRRRAWIDAPHWAMEASTPAAPVAAFVAGREREVVPGLPARYKGRNYSRVRHSSVYCLPVQVSSPCFSQ